MKFSEEILIELPREAVILKMQDQVNYNRWQRGLISCKSLCGKPGEGGSQSKLKFNWGGREVAMIETVVKIVPPKKLHTTYEANGIYITRHNNFEKIAQDRTRWILDIEFQFKGTMRIIGLLNAGAFKKQILQYMEDFKEYAERGKTVFD